jgi:hypothetical protein
MVDNGNPLLSERTYRTPGPGEDFHFLAAITHLGFLFAFLTPASQGTIYTPR